MQSIRIYEMPDCKMVSSGAGMFGEEKFNRFEEWFSSQKRVLFPKDFLYGGEDGFHWLYIFEDGMTVPPEFEIIDFQGGLYAVATDIDQKTDTGLMKAEVDQFLSENGFERDTSRFELGNIITSPLAHEIMGYEQMDYYFPIKAKNKCIQHPQENIIKTYDYNGITVELVEWNNTVWCGKIGYADNNTDEPNVEKIMEDFMSVSVAPVSRESNWDVCMSVNYLSGERPSGVMFGFLVANEDQPKQYDIYGVPAARFLRIRLCDETAKALGHDPWTGGIPPYQWIGEQIAPELGFTYGADTLPVIEYYGFFKPEKGAHEYCYLYVPVKENSDT